jgi:hypothetical protein
VQAVMRGFLSKAEPCAVPVMVGELSRLVLEGSGPGAIRDARHGPHARVGVSRAGGSGRRLVGDL